MSATERPAWADFLTDPQYALLTSLLQAGVRRHGAEADFDALASTPTLRIQHPKHGLIVLHIGNLAHSLAAFAPDTHAEAWKRQVAHHLRVALATAADADGPVLEDFSQVRDRLRLRVLPSDDPTIDGMVGLVVAAGLTAVLAIDLPDAVVTVPTALAATWGLETRELLGLALHQTLQDPADHETISQEGVTVQVMSGDGWFVASRALALEQWVDAPAGAFVAMPTRHHALYHPIVDDTAISAVYALWSMATAAFEEGPGAVSPSVFWWKPGRFAKIEISLDETTGALSLALPSDLQAELAALVGPES